MAGGDGMTKFTPPVIWAQRADRIYLTINLEDVENTEIKLEEKQLYFKGKGGTDKKWFELTVEFYSDVNPDDSKYGVMPRNIPMVIKKKEEGPFWPRLLKEKGKKHWLKTDFDKWRDEDDSDQDEKQDFQLEDMMQQMGNFNSGSPNGGDMGMDDEEDSDDDELPDLEDNSEKKIEEDSKNSDTKEDQKS